VSDPKIEPSRAFSPAHVAENLIPKDESPHKISPFGGIIKDAVISQERAGHADTKADPAKFGSKAKIPPISTKPIPTSSISERLREQLKKGK
jgi:hypothetical protein